VRSVELLSTAGPSNTTSVTPETPPASTAGSPVRPTAPTMTKPPSGARPSPGVPRVSESPRTSEPPRGTERPRVSEPAGARDPFRVPESSRTPDAARSTEAPRKDTAATVIVPRRPQSPAIDESHRERAMPARPSVDEKSSVAAGVPSAPRPSVQRTPDDGAADGSAAIDWLLKNRGSDGR